MRDTRKTALHEDARSAPAYYPLSFQSLSSLVVPQAARPIVSDTSRAASELSSSRDVQARIDRTIGTLTLKNLAAQAAYITGLGTIITTTWPYAIHNLPPVVTGICAFISITNFTLKWVKGLQYRRNLVSLQTDPELIPLQSKAQKIVDTLSPHFGLNGLRVVVDKDSSFAALVSRLVYPSVVTIAPSCKKFTDAELTAVLAHEIAHSNRPHALFRRCNSFLNCFAGPVVVASSLCLAAPYAVNFLSSGLGFWATTIGYFAAFMATSLLLIYVKNFFEHLTEYMSRNHELATDLRAVQVTKDPVSFISALRTTWESLAERSQSSYEDDGQAHPSFSRRIRNIGDVFGIPGRDITESYCELSGATSVGYRL